MRGAGRRRAAPAKLAAGCTDRARRVSWHTLLNRVAINPPFWSFQALSGSLPLGMAVAGEAGKNRARCVLLSFSLFFKIPAKISDGRGSCGSYFLYPDTPHFPGLLCVFFFSCFLFLKTWRGFERPWALFAFSIHPSIHSAIYIPGLGSILTLVFSFSGFDVAYLFFALASARCFAG